MLATMVWGIVLTACAAALLLPPMVLLLRPLHERRGRFRYRVPAPLNLPAQPAMPRVLTTSLAPATAKLDEPVATPAQELRRAA